MISTSTWLPLLREALNREGACRFPLRGGSMRPTLPLECEIKIVPLPSRVRLGALIVFVDGEMLIAHRLVRRDGGQWIAQGDGRWGPDRPLAPAQVLGIVTAAYADGRRCWPTIYSRPLAAFWLARHHVLRGLRAAVRGIRKQ